MKNVIHNEPNLTTMSRMPDGFVDCVVTSPPYWGFRDYGTDGEQWPEVTYQPMPGLPEIVIPEMTAQLGLEPTPEAFVGHIVHIFREVKRVLKDSGTCWLNFGDSYTFGSIESRNFPHLIRRRRLSFDSYTSGSKKSRNPGQSEIHPAFTGDSYVVSGRPDTQNGLKPKDLIGIPWRVAFALQADGWYLRSDIIWAKPNPMPESVTDRPTKAHEYIFLLSKSERYFYDAEAAKEKAKTNGQKIKTADGWKSLRNRRTVWNISTKRYSGAHFAVFPPDLVKPCVLVGAPEKVCERCGRPWERVVEKEPMEFRKSTRGADMGKHGRTAASGTMTKPPASKTVGWAPTCGCEAPTIRGLVYDPFGGSGTTAEVAHQYGRDWIISEINPKYVEDCIRPRLEKNNQKTLF